MTATPAERLRAAADRLPSDPALASIKVRNVAYPDCWEVVGLRDALIAECYVERDARAVAALLAASGSIAAWLREQATDMDRHLAYDCMNQEHCTPDCGLSWLPNADPRCAHYDRALAVADAVLAAGGGAT